MITKRIIPCLDIKDGRVVKGVNFIGLQDVGCPVLLAQKYNNELADELVFLDITATNESRKTMLEVVNQVAKEVFIPLTVGGGISTIKDVSNLLLNGADKVAINSAAVANPQLISELAQRFGSQCVVVAIDVKRHGDEWCVYTHGGTKPTKLSAESWVKRAIDLGAGELLITSIDADGSKNGFDIELYKKLANVSIPIIASGGAGKVQDFFDVFTKTQVSGALAASIFHYNSINTVKLKQQLAEKGVAMRL